MAEKMDLKEYEELFNTINDNSSKERNKKNEQRIKETDYHLKEEKKDNFRKRLTILFIMIVLVITLISTFPTIKGTISRELELQRANQYMSIYIDSSIDMEKIVLSDGKVVPFDNSSSTYKIIAEQLQNEVGLSRDCAIYCISEKYGQDAFNMVVKEYGYESSNDFLEKCYAVATDTSSSGMTPYGTHGSYEYFENSVQTELVTKVKEIQNRADLLSNEQGGLKR